MTDARLQFRPELPLCWEDPHTIRLGFDRAIARLERPSAGAQRLLSALRVGIRPADLSTTAFAPSRRAPSRSEEVISRPVTTPSNEILSSRKETMSPLGRHRKAGCGFLTAASVQFDLEVELLPLIKRRKLGSFYRGSVHEDVLASVIGCDKAVTLD